MALDFNAMLDPQGGFDPALGRLLATNPEAIIPHLAAAGIEPPMLEARLGMNRDQPSEIPGEAPQVASDAQPPSVPNDPMANPYAPHNLIRSLFGATGAAPQPPASGGFGSYSRETQDVPTEPAPTVDLSATRTPAPRSRPGNLGAAVAPTASASASAVAEAEKAKSSGLAQALAGVKAPPAPVPQRISTPSVPGASAVPQGSPIAALLSQVISGQQQPATLLRLRQALEGGR